MSIWCCVKKVSCQNNIVSTHAVSRRWRVKTVSYQDSVVSEQRCDKKNVVVPRRRHDKAAPCQCSAVSTRCRVKSVSCQNGVVSKIVSCQHDVVSTRRRANIVSWQNEFVSARHRKQTQRCINTSSCQYYAPFNTAPCQHNDVTV